MGAFKVEVMLHDAELEEFVRQALEDELTPEARYIAARICDEIPELLPVGLTSQLSASQIVEPGE